MKRITFLGTGSSTGIPIINCECPVCHSNDTKDKRTRISILLQSDHANILIDLSPDLRTQLLRNPIPRLDAILITHAHNDHIAGLDEIRIFNFLQKSSIPVYSDSGTLHDIQQRFSYIFQQTQVGGGKPSVDLIEIQPYNPFTISDFNFLPVKINHGKIEILGYIIDNKIAYLSDISGVPERTSEIIKNIDTIVMGAVRCNPHPTHFSFNEALQAIRLHSPKQSFFIHMNHDLSHRELESRYSPEVTIPYDGYSIDLD